MTPPNEAQRTSPEEGEMDRTITAAELLELLGLGTMRMQLAAGAQGQETS